MNKELISALGKITEQEALMNMLDRDDRIELVRNDFIQNYWKMLDNHKTQITDNKFGTL